MSKLVMTIAAAATACGAGPDMTSQQPANTNEQSTEQSAELVARSQPAFEAALTRFDAATGDQRQILAGEVDRLAAQRYATVSRLYWHTEIDDAVAEARERDLPILSLRMLGDLGEDYSCANSRFFRIALYANAEVSKLLRDSFVLHWSSERNAPKITIDYGDGRIMRRTIAGNSAHYVLDSNGRPVDVLPGLYSPTAFIKALGAASTIAAQVADLSAGERSLAVAAFHTARLQAAPPAAGQIYTAITSGGLSIIDAERIAVTKAAVELPILDETQLAGVIDQARGGVALRARVARLAEKVTLDDRSRALVAALAPIDWRKSRTAHGAEVDALIAAFEASISIDSAINEHGLHNLISRRFASRVATEQSFDELNGWIYASLFRTPAADPWLGMGSAGAFTALPSSGVEQPSLATRR